LGWLLLVPALALSLHAQPSLTIEDGAVITWPASATNYIVQWANTPEGPWIPCLDPIASGPGYCAMAVPCIGECKYFRLAPGQRFEDDFEDGDLEGWTVAYADPQATNNLSLVLTNGQLLIHGLWPGSGLDRHVLFHRTNLVLADFAMSIDILGWDESDGGDIPNIVLVGRLNPSYVTLTNSYWYGGGAGMRYSGDLTKSAMFLWKQLGVVGYGGSSAFEKTDPAKDYRLVFSGTGFQFTVQSFDLSDGTLRAEYSGTDNILTGGWVGFYVVEHGLSGTVGFWLDNFVAVGTTP
jgi:hypothetical protein